MMRAASVNMPFLAAGIVNGVAHAKGYRNFEIDDSATNLRAARHRDCG